MPELRSMQRNVTDKIVNLSETGSSFHESGKQNYDKKKAQEQFRWVWSN